MLPSGDAQDPRASPGTQRGHRAGAPYHTRCCAPCCTCHRPYTVHAPAPLTPPSVQRAVDVAMAALRSQYKTEKDDHHEVLLVPFKGLRSAEGACNI